MAVVTYKIVPVIFYDVLRETQGGDEILTLPVARCPDEKTADVVAWSLTEDERGCDDDHEDTIRDVVREERH